jgi:hypothetical protein
MAWSPKLEKILLTIPYMILSTGTNLSAEVEKHILTPFGYIDVIFPNGFFTRDDEGDTHLEVKVIGDIDSWMLHESMPDEFKSALRTFIIEMVKVCAGSSLAESSRNSLHLKREGQNIQIILSE